LYQPFLIQVLLQYKQFTGNDWLMIVFENQSEPYAWRISYEIMIFPILQTGKK